MKKYSFKRSVAYVLALALCLLSPLTVLAENGGLPDGGVFVEKAVATAPEYVLTEETPEPAAEEESKAAETDSMTAVQESAEETAAVKTSFTVPVLTATGSNATPSVATSTNAVFAPGSGWYKSAAPKSGIKYVSFVENGSSYGVPDEGTWYADAEGKGDIVCFFYDTGTNEELYICNMTEGEFRLNADSSDFLKGFTSLIEIYNITLLNTADATNMNSMFEDCAKISALDLSNFDTSKVLTGQRFTAGTTDLVEIKLGTGWTGACLLSKPTQPATDGLWYDETAQKAYEPEQIPVRKAATYTARPLYPVTFNMNGHGTQVETQLVYYGGKVKEPAAPTAPGWVFCGWYTDANCTKSWDFEEDVMSKTQMTLYAKWQEPNYELYPSGGWYAGTAVATMSDITKIVIGDTVPVGTPDDKWNADSSRNGGVRCYVKDNVLYMVPYVAGHQIKLPYSCDHMFDGFTSLETIEGIERLDMSSVRSMESFFEGCESFTGFSSLLTRVSGVVNMKRMFAGCTAMKNVDLSGLDMSACTSISGMFYGCTGLKEVDLHSLDTSHVTDMSVLFANCSSLEKVTFAKSGETNLFDSSEVTTMRGMFDCCTSLKDLNLSGLNTDKVIYMNYMFRDCRSLETLTFTDQNMEKVQNMSNMFAVCSSLQSLDLSMLKTVSVTDMNAMFSGMSSLTSLNLGGQFTTAAVRDYRFMFNKCTALTELDLSNFVTVNVAENRGKDFTAATEKLEKVTLGAGWDGSLVLDPPNENLTDGKWYSSGGTAYDPEDIPAGADVYTSRTNRHTVHFNMMGHGRQEADEYYAAGTSVKEPDTPAETGQKFEGWYADETLNTPWDFATDKMPAEDLTLYAKWTTVEYTVDLDSNYTDAQHMKSMLCKYGEAYTLPLMTITRTGYRFKSWNTSPEGLRKEYRDGDTIENLSKVHQSTVKLYAQWTANHYTVQFEGNGATSGSMAAVKDCEYDSYYELPVNQFRRTGYTFDGWNTSQDGKGQSYKDHASVRNLSAEDNGVAVLYAQWIRNTVDGQTGLQNGSSSSGGSSSGGSGSSSGGSSSGGSSSGGSSSGGSGGAVVMLTAAKQNLPAWVDSTGSWTNNSTDNSWTYKKQDGTAAKSEWVCAYNPYAASGSRAYDWFFFDENGNMITGWYTDKNGNTYYLNPASDGSRGKMMTGRQLIDGVWYTFSEAEGSGTMGALIR